MKQNDPLLWFPPADSSDDKASLLTPPASIVQQACSTPFNQDQLFSDEDKISEFFSVSQMGSMFSLNNPEYQPSFSGGTSSRLLDYFSEDEHDANTLLLMCQFHGLTFDDINGFEEHQISEHTVRGRILCGLCDKSYSTKYLWRNHFKAAHLGEKFECSVKDCGKKFSQKRYRDEHEKTHNTSKTGVVYVCELCDQVCNSLDNLKKHKLNHSSAKKHICRICKIRGFTRTNDRLRHEEECGPKFNVRVNDDGEVVTLDTPDNPPPKKIT